MGHAITLGRGIEMIPVLYKVVVALTLAIAGMLLHFLQVAIPNSESLVVLLWTCVGGLVALVLLMLRLWYRDFGNRWDELRIDISEIKTGLSDRKVDITKLEGRVTNLEDKPKRKRGER
jgi:hypothetical protein